MAQRVENYRRSYDRDENLERRMLSLVPDPFTTMQETAEFGFRKIPVRPGRGRVLEGLDARVDGRRVTTFPLLVLARSS